MSAKKKTGCAFFVIFGSLIKLLYTVMNVIAHFLAIIFGFFGLWIPLLYALVGAALYGFLNFNPFELHLEGQLYIAGFAACCACSLIITIRNLILKPIKSTIQGFREPIWSKKKVEDKGYPKKPVGEPKQRISQNNNAADGNVCSNAVKASEIEKPEIYFSQMESVLVHEYADRFEIYELSDGRLKLDRVEYK